jgi:predicted double-glycine peptidase
LEFSVATISSRPSLFRAASAALLGVAAGCTTAPAGPAQLWMGQVSQGAPTQTVALKSWKELKFDSLVRQQTDFSCGAAAMATIFKYAYGKRTTERQVLVNMLKVADPDLVREKGFSLLDMKHYARAVGMAAEGYQVEYDALRDLKVPAIALLNLRGYKHFVVIRKADANFVHVGDPALGNRVMSRAQFEQAWNKVVFVMTGKGFNPDTVLLNPPPPLSARRLFGERSPVFNADAAEFGFGPAFSFRL